VDEGYVIGADGVRLFYRVVRSQRTHSARPDVVLLHGGPGSNMNAVWPDLEPLATERTILMYDQRGSGRSELVNDPDLLTAEHHVRDLEAIRLHFGLENMILAGHSWGAGLAVLYAAEYPQHIGRLLILGPMPPTKVLATSRFSKADESMGFHRYLSELRIAMPSASDPVSLCERFFNAYLKPYFADPAALRRKRGNPCDAPPEAVRNWLVVSDATFASLGDWDFLPILSQLNVEALIVDGEVSLPTVESARAWAAAMPGARLLLVPDAGHFPQVEQPDVFFPRSKASSEGVGRTTHASWSTGGRQLSYTQ
jgi:proline iminopeptidase